MFMIIRNDCHIHLFSVFPVIFLVFLLDELPYSCLLVIQILYLPYVIGPVPFLLIPASIFIGCHYSLNVLTFEIIYKVLLHGLFCFQWSQNSYCCVHRTMVALWIQIYIILRDVTICSTGLHGPLWMDVWVGSGWKQRLKCEAGASDIWTCHAEDTNEPESLLSVNCAYISKIKCG